jgi:hypothetical protein
MNVRSITVRGHYYSFVGIDVALHKMPGTDTVTIVALPSWDAEQEFAEYISEGVCESRLGTLEVRRVIPVEDYVYQATLHSARFV